MNKWDRRFMAMAMQVRSWSKDPNNQVGAVLVSPDRREFAVGYNGMPAGFKDDGGLVEMASKLGENVAWLKAGLAVHAEVNAVLNCRARPVGWTMYSTRCLCLACAATLVQAGVTTLFCPSPEPDSSWYTSHKAALQLLQYQVSPRVLVSLMETET